MLVPFINNIGIPISFELFSVVELYYPLLLYCTINRY